jgi:hypothetical protein
MDRLRAPWIALVVLLSFALVACGELAGFDPTGSAASASPTGSAKASGSPSASPARTETPDDRVDSEDNHASAGNRRNIVEILNRTPGNLKLRASVQLNRIKGDVVTPLNAALAVGQDCTGCQTIAVALNLKCSKCITISHAVQYALPVDDPEDDNNDGQDAKSAKDLLRQMQKELDAIAKEKGLTADIANQRVQAVIARFNALANSMRQDVKRTEEENSPSPSPMPSPMPSPSGSPARSAAPSASPTRSPSPTP